MACPKPISSERHLKRFRAKGAWFAARKAGKTACKPVSHARGLNVGQEEIERLRVDVNFANMADPRNVSILGHLTQAEREEFAFETKSLVLYFGEEVELCRQAEESAALRAMPKGCRPEDLNGLNIGCGNRLISPYLMPIDIMRHVPGDKIGGEHNALTPGAFLALPDALPFRPDSIDYIVSLHTLEHVSDPVGVILHWLDILKPGGGLGVVIPDWRYAWDARQDAAPYGHKWNSSPDMIESMYRNHWSSKCALEQLSSYNFRISFDFVLRKPGLFKPFSRKHLEIAPSGRQIAESGRFLGFESAD